MKKTIFLLMATIILLAGCTLDSLRNDKDADESVLVLGLDASSVANRTIVPAIDMNAATYDVYGAGPNSESFEVLNVIGSSVTVTDLVAGTWNITVNAKNSIGTIIGNGITSVDIQQGSTVNATVSVSPLSGNGAAALTVDWIDASQFTDAANVSGTLEYKTATGYDAPVSMTFSKIGQTATYSSSLTAGYYRLLLQVAESGVDTLYLAESVRIVYNETTSATIFISDIQNTGDVQITIEENMLNPIVITFSGQSSQIQEGTDMIVTAATVPSPVDSYEWYLDGQLLAGETTESVTIGSTLEVRAAAYTLTLMVGLNSILSTQSITFTVVEAPPASLIDNFEDGADPNLWGADYSIMNDFGGLTMSYDSANAYNGSAYALALDYSVANTDEWSGLLIPFASGFDPVNISMYEYLSFWIKGSVANTPIKIGLENTSTGDRNRATMFVDDYLDGGVTTSYQEVRIPLDAFANLDDFTNAKVISLVFENSYATANGAPTTGIVYLDDIGFGSTSLGYVRIDHFGDNFGQNAVGGNSGSMGGETATHTSSFDNTEFHNYSRSLRSEYNIGTADWCGMWFILGGGADAYTAVPCDFSGYSNLTMWIKGNSAGETPAKIKIELNDTAGHVALIPDDTVEGTAISTTWTKYTINLSTFSGLNTAAIQQFNFVYDSLVGANTSGVVFFDEIQLEE